MKQHVNRTLLYVSQRHDASLSRLLTQRGWRIVFASTPRDLTALKTDGSLMAGLLDLDCGYADEELEAFEPWLAERSIGWLALAASPAEVSDLAGRLIGLYFVDYYTLPCEPEDLARSLGHAVGIARLRPGAGREIGAPHPIDGMIGQCAATQCCSEASGRYRAGTRPC